MLKPNIEYKVTLTAEEREFLRQLVKKGNTPATGYATHRYCWPWTRHPKTNTGRTRG